jgi:hypothetical protein
MSALSIRTISGEPFTIAERNRIVDALGITAVNLKGGVDYLYATKETQLSFYIEALILASPDIAKEVQPLVYSVRYPAGWRPDLSGQFRRAAMLTDALPAFVAYALMMLPQH